MNEDNREEDPLLRAFVKMAERGLESNITLSVGGMLISGTLTSYSEYLKHVSEDMGVITIPEIRDAMTEVFTNAAESAQNSMREIQREEEMAESSGQEPDDAFMPAYIHLRDTRFFLPGGVSIPPQGGASWRGKIASVDGFVLGTFTPSR
jgi:hypothetical protein